MSYYTQDSAAEFRLNMLDRIHGEAIQAKEEGMDWLLPDLRDEYRDMLNAIRTIDGEQAYRDAGGRA